MIPAKIRVDVHIVHAYPITFIWIAFILALAVGWHFGG